MQVGNISASFTRPANVLQYAVGGLVANNLTAALVAPMPFKVDNSFPMAQFRLTRARLFKTNPDVTNASFRLHLYQAVAPTVTNGDGAPWLSNGSANWLGNVDITSMVAFSDGAAGTGSCPAGSEMIIRVKTGVQIWGLLAALGTYTPTSGETFNTTIEITEAY